MSKAPKWGINTYVKLTRQSIGRHKKRLNKHDTYKKYRGQGR